MPHFPLPQCYTSAIWTCFSLNKTNDLSKTINTELLCKKKKKTMVRHRFSLHLISNLEIVQKHIYFVFILYSLNQCERGSVNASFNVGFNWFCSSTDLHAFSRVRDAQLKWMQAKFCCHLWRQQFGWAPKEQVLLHRGQRCHVGVLGGRGEAVGRWGQQEE